MWPTWQHAAYAYSLICMPVSLFCAEARPCRFGGIFDAGLNRYVAAMLLKHLCSTAPVLC